MFKELLEKTKSVFRRFAACASRQTLRHAAWYAALALLLMTLGIASWRWRGQGSLRAGDDPSFIHADAAAADAVVNANEILSPEDMPPISTLTDILTEMPLVESTEAPLSFQWPVAGEVIGRFTADSLAWSDTLRQWQTHPATDIAAAMGEGVCACAPGVVLETWEDALWGKTIRIQHAQGYVSTYSNLSTLRLVKPGDDVQAGQVISAVGNSAPCESEMPSHLHFALEKDGIPVNIETLIPE